MRSLVLSEFYSPDEEKSAMDAFLVQNAQPVEFGEALVIIE